MKYVDGPTLEVEVLIGASLERVWQLATDIDVPARFSSEFLGGRWVDVGPEYGARFVGRNRHKLIGNWETTSIVHRYAPMREFGWCVSDIAIPSSTWWFELEQERHGVRLRQGTRMGPGPSGLSMLIAAMPDKEERIVAHRLVEFARNMRATVQGIKDLAEG